MKDNQLSTSSILSEEKLAFCQNKKISTGSGQIIEPDWNEPYSKSPLSEKELDFLLTLKRKYGANQQILVKRVRCREKNDTIKS